MKISKFKIIILFILLLNFCTAINAENLQIEADNITYNNFKQELLDEHPSTEKSGRIWTDKSVVAKTDKPINVDNHEISFNDDFLEIFSALGSNSEIGETKNSPIDLVLNIDCSDSMGFEAENAAYDETLGRKPLVIDKSAQAINQIVDFIMNKNPNNHIALVVYQKEAKTIFPLGRYEHLDGKPFLEVEPTPGDSLSENGAEGFYYTVNFSALKDGEEINEKVSTVPKDPNNLGRKSNFHVGFLESLKILAENKEAQESENRAKIINLTDGNPNCALSDSWQDIQDPSAILDNDEPDNIVQKEALVLQTVLTTAYLKAAVSKNYSYPLEFVLLYIKAGFNEKEDPLLLNAIINKDNYLNSKSTLENETLELIRKDFQKWLNGEDLKLEKVAPQFNRNGFTIAAFNESNNYNVTKEEMINSISYVDLFEELSATEQSQVFQDLVDSFNQKDYHPIENKEDNNDLIFNEPIGEYMQVTPKKIILFNKEYPLESQNITTQDNKTVETFSPSVSDKELPINSTYIDPVSFNPSNIQLILETENTKQNLKIIIPEECLPVVNTEVNCEQFYEDPSSREISSIKDNRDESESLPIRIIYGVNLISDIKDKDGNVDLTKISEEYKAQHLHGETIDFFTTHYSKPVSKQDNKETIGDAYSEFSPSLENEYYITQDELPVYLDKNLSSVLNNSENFDEDKEYYLKKTYYGYKNNQPSILETSNSIKGTEVEFSNIISQSLRSSGNYTILPGLNYIGDLQKFNVEKDKNITDTAGLAYSPVADEENNTIESIRTYLGNNGKMALTVRFDINISITKYQAIGENSLTKDRLTVSADDIITYQLNINNLSNKKVENILVTDEIPQGLEIISNSISNNGSFVDGIISWILDLNANEEINLTYQVKVPSAKTGDYKNFFTIEYEDADKTVTLDSNIVESVLETPSLDLVKYQALNNLDKTTQKQTAKAGDYLTYFFEVTNNGNGTAKNVKVRDEIPEELILDEKTISNNGILNGKEISWNIPELKSKEARLLSFSVHIPENSNKEYWENTAFSSHDQDETPKPSNTVVIEKTEPDLSIVKMQSLANNSPTTNNLDVSNNDVVTYYLKVTNNSSLITAHNLIITDPISEGLILNENSINNNGYTNNNVVTWNIPSLDPLASIELTFQVTVPNNDSNSSWNNIATLISDETQNTPFQSNQVTIQKFDKPVKTSNIISSNANSSSQSNSTSKTSSNPKTGNESDFNALIWLIGLLSIIFLTGEVYQIYK